MTIVTRPEGTRREGRGKKVAGENPGRGVELSGRSTQIHAGGEKEQFPPARLPPTEMGTSGSRWRDGEAKRN